MGLETGEWRRCRSLPFTPPASLRSHGFRPRPTRHIPPSPLAGRGVPTRLCSTPPSPPSRGEPVRAAAVYLGVRTDEAREKEMEGWGVTEKREGREEKKTISARFPDTLLLGPQPAERLTRHPSSTQEHGSESSVPPVLLLLQHHRFGQPLAVSATSCCPISSAPRSPSAARALWQRVPPSSRVSAPM